MDVVLFGASKASFSIDFHQDRSNLNISNPVMFKPQTREEIYDKNIKIHLAKCLS